MGKLQLQVQYQRTVVRGGPELAHARFPVGGKAVPDHAEGLDAGHHGRRGVEVVDSTPVPGTGEGKRVQLLALDVGEVGKPCQIILREEFGGVLRKSIYVVVGPGDAVHVSGEDPPVLGGAGIRSHGVLHHPAHFPEAGRVTFVTVCALLPECGRIFGDVQAVLLRPGVHRDKVQGVLPDKYPGPAGAVAHRNGRVPGHAQHPFQRKARGDHLREKVPFTAHEDVAVTVPRGQLLPMRREIERIAHVRESTGLPAAVMGLGFAPDADVRRGLRNVAHKVVVVVFLVGPHAVLDIPIQNADLVGCAAGQKQQQACGEYGAVFHAAKIQFFFSGMLGFLRENINFVRI